VEEKNPFQTLVWREEHENHNFLKAGIYDTYFGLMYMYKCDKCGDIKINWKKKVKINGRK